MGEVFSSVSSVKVFGVGGRLEGKVIVGASKEEMANVWGVGLCCQALLLELPRSLVKSVYKLSTTPNKEDAPHT